MTIQIYDDHPYQQTFTAQVLRSFELDSQPAAVLDQTLFYPTGGGQPHDTGWLNHVPVLAVEKRNGEIVHLLAKSVPPGRAHGSLDWERRFDFMQQHSGQHLLSQCFMRLLKTETIGFHLSQDYTTIDLDSDKLGWHDIMRVERLANQLIQENRPITTAYMPPELVTTLPLRKPPPDLPQIRIVEIEDFDWSACAGTHVAQTGEIGLIKVIKLERNKGGWRLTFLCGQRALAHYQQVYHNTETLSRRLSVAGHEVVDAVDTLREQVKQQRRQIADLQNQLRPYEAQTLLIMAQAWGEYQLLVQQSPTTDREELRRLAQTISRTAGVVVALAATDTASAGQPVVLAAADDVPLDLRRLIPDLKKTFGFRGGGPPHLVQGLTEAQTGLPALLAHLKTTLETELQALL